MQYTVEYQEAGVNKSDSYMDVSNPGAAFAQCLKEHPDAKLLRAVAYGRQQDLDKYGHTIYQPPPVQRSLERKPRPSRFASRLV